MHVRTNKTQIHVKHAHKLTEHSESNIINKIHDQPCSLYTCMYIHIHICMYIHIHTYLFMCVYEYIYIYMYLNKHIHMHIHRCI